MRHHSIWLMAVLSVVTLGLFGGSVARGQEDRTSDFTEFAKRHFIGITEDQGLTTIEDNTRTYLGVKTGNELKARGLAKIERLESVTGSIKRITLDEFVFWKTDMTFVWYYTGQTSAEKWGWPGGVLIDRPWNDLHPTGRITIRLKSQPQKNGQIAATITVEGGHPDRPNAFMKDVAYRMVPKFAKMFKEYNGLDSTIQ